MAIITEDYVSFDIEKLLKEKGFNIDECEVHYDLLDHTQYNITLQMAMKWLREVHNLHIDVDPSEGDWNPTVLELENWTCAVKFGDDIQIQDSYEEACEAAIKYCLENLI